MRTAQEVRFAIKWNTTEDQLNEHEWASTLPPQLIDGETIHLYARLPAKTEKPPVLICKTLVNDQEKEVSSAKPNTITWDTDGIVARLCAAAQIAELTESTVDTHLANSLAVKYQLITQHTNFFLVHQRAEGAQAEGLPKLQQVPQMQAAGWAGHGILRVERSNAIMCLSSTMSSPSLGGDYGRLNTPSVWRTSRTQAAGKVDGMASAGMDDIEIPAFLRKQTDSVDLQAKSSKMLHSTIATDQERLAKPAPSDATVEDIANALNAASMHASSFRIALQQSLKLNLPHHYAQVIIDLTKVTKDSATSWALLFNWLFGDIEQSELLDRHSKRLVRSQLKLATAKMQEHAQALIERNLVTFN
jgi:hypothetical protein